jgi:CBS domain containing-hemolysin-like protein
LTGQRSSADQSGGLHAEEVQIISGALKFRDMTVADVMTPSSEAFMLPASGRLNFQVIK